MQQAWSFKAIDKNDLRYWGNDGYHDDSSVFYRYDSFVANHKKVKQGDIVIITNRDKLLGISVINLLKSHPIQKKRNKCTHIDCNSKKILLRKTIKPEWRCDNGHEFDTPRVVFEPAIEFIANYSDDYKKVTNISMEKLISETPRYNGQMSIQEVNLAWAAEILGSHPAQYLSMDATEAENDIPELLDEDQRALVERQIRQRRGQKKFRDNLLKSNPVCAVTGCALTDILEAAHIDSYRNNTHNDIGNGILLRSDMHTLFDLNLCAINPKTNTIHFSKKSLSNGYDKFEGVELKIKHKLLDIPLKKRWGIFKNT